MISYQISLFLIVVAFFSLLSSVDFAVGVTTTESPLVTVTIRENSFEPSNSAEYYQPSLLLITEGTTVKWENQDGVEHTVTSGTSIAGSDGRFDSKLIFSDKSFQFTFKESGEYGYFCKIHPWMIGAIVVAPESIFKISLKESLNSDEDITLNIFVNINIKNTYYFPKNIDSISPSITIYDSKNKSPDSFPITRTIQGGNEKFSEVISIRDPFWKNSEGPYTAELRLETHTAQLISITKFDFDNNTPEVSKIPDWVKNNAEWWADGLIDDKAFVQGIQFLIKEGIMKIPPTTEGSGTGSNEIPTWVKNNAEWWADGLIDDKAFVQGIQFLIKEGIMKIPPT